MKTGAPRRDGALRHFHSTVPPQAARSLNDPDHPMLRPLPSRPSSSRLSGIRLAAPLARLSLLVAGLALAQPAGAQSIGAVTKPNLPDPWHGVIIITPHDADLAL
ncbi:hypothetical protein ACFSKM_08315 [Ancylobacter dichloromethanicus]